ncbi:MAG: BatA domain-containing protein [Planctomycetota bacterium]|jgi:hypothetical protein
MAFESPIFLATLGAVAAPIIIHLIFRLRKRVVIFGSLRFLEKIVKKNRRRLRLRDLILLLLRIAAVALIALAFAQPYLKTGPGAGEGERQDVVYVLDDTFSMGAARLARTNLEEAKNRITDDLASLKPGDRAGAVLVTGGGRVLAQLSTDVSVVAAKLRAAVPTFERAELAPALRRAAEILAAADAPKRRVAVASDLQGTSWTEAALSGLPREGIDFASVLPTSNEPNISIVGAEAESDFWTPGVPVKVVARVANFGKADAAGVPLRLFAGSSDAPRARRMVDVAAGETQAVQLAFDAAAAGEFPARIEIEGRDALAADDVRHLVLRLRDRLKVPCVQDEIATGGDRFSDASYFVRVSLDPRLKKDTPPVTPFAPIAAEARTLDEATLRDADAVFLLGVSRLTDDQASALGEWVRAGGGLAIAPSGAPGRSDADAAPVNGALAKAGLAAAKVAGEVEAAPLYPEGIPMTEWDRAHPVWSVFAGAEGTGPDRARAKRFLKLSPVEGARVIAEFDRARPAAAELVSPEGAAARTPEDETGVGRGRVVQLAFGLGAGATDFPKKKAFVPFIHGLARYLARSAAAEAPPAVEVGTALPIGELLAAASQGGELTDPDGAVVKLASAAAPPLAERPGIHRLKRRLLGQTVTGFVAVNAPAVESDLRTDGEEAFLAALGTERPAAAAARARRQGADDDAARSRLWAVVLALVAGMLLLESMLANRVLLGARSGEPAGAGR